MADSLDMAGSHATHDLDLIARAAAGDLASGEATSARELLASCPVCVATAGDLRAIAAATRELRSVAGQIAAAPTPRDFRLTETDAARLRRRRWFGLGGLTPAGRARGLGGALATLGLAGLLLATASPALLGAAGGAATALETVGAAVGIPEDAATLGPLEAPPAADGPTTKASPEALRSEISTVDAGAPLDGRIILAVGSALVFVAGVVLLLWTRGRKRSGP